MAYLKTTEILRLCPQNKKRGDLYFLLLFSFWQCSISLQLESQAKNQEFFIAGETKEPRLHFFLNIKNSPQKTPHKRGVKIIIFML